MTDFKQLNFRFSEEEKKVIHQAYILSLDPVSDDFPSRNKWLRDRMVELCRDLIKKKGGKRGR